MTNQNQASTELEYLKEEHFSIYQELLQQFKSNSQICHEWLTIPKLPLKGRTPFEQLSINADEVMSMLVRMRTGDFS